MKRRHKGQANAEEAVASSRLLQLRKTCMSNFFPMSAQGSQLASESRCRGKFRELFGHVLGPGRYTEDVCFEKFAAQSGHPPRPASPPPSAQAAATGPRTCAVAANALAPRTSRRHRYD